MIGCDNNTKQPKIMNESQAEEWRQKEYPNTIAIETTFTPTVDIELLDSMSLEDLVIQNCFLRTFEELKAENADYTIDDYRIYIAAWYLRRRRESFPRFNSVNLKYVPANSNLAKAYCLQSPIDFEEYNRSFCESVKRKHDAELKHDKEQKAQSTWDKYLE